MKYHRPIRRICFIFVTGEYNTAPRAIRECTALSEKYRIEVLEFNPSMNLPATARDGKVVIRRVKPRSWPSSKFLKIFFLMLAMLPEIARTNADVYHSFGFTELFLSTFGKIIHRSKLVYDAYEVYPYQYARIAKPPLRSIVWSSVTAFENLFLKLCNVVLVVPSFRDEVANRFKLKFKAVFTVWNVPSKGLIAELPRDQFHETFNLFYAGAISKYTGVSNVLKAFVLANSNFRGLKLVLVGNVDKHSTIYNELDTVMREHKNVTLLKAMPHHELEHLYLNSDAGLALYPPTYWTCRTKASEKVFEYMSYSLPVITSNFPGLSEIITETESGLLVNPLDPESISKAILLLCENRRYSELLGANGRKAVLNSFNWETRKISLFQAYCYLENERSISSAFHFCKK
jgi:glycosyltransferase involved in cell wall biosynthesis